MPDGRGYMDRTTGALVIRGNYFQRSLYRERFGNTLAYFSCVYTIGENYGNDKGNLRDRPFSNSIVRNPFHYLSSGVFSFLIDNFKSPSHGNVNCRIDSEGRVRGQERNFRYSLFTEKGEREFEC